MSQRIEQFIKSFFKGDYSETTRTKFAWWMVHSDTNASEKEKVFEDLWADSANAVNPDVFQDLKRLKSRTYNNIYKYWAIAASLLFIIAIGGFLSIGTTSVDSNELVKINVPYGNCERIVLEDNTVVIVNAGSILLYPKHFDKTSRKVFLVGEAIFDVCKDQDRPFTVETQCLNVTALGTKFSVSAFTDAKTANTTLEEGRTKVVIDNVYINDNNNGTFVLEPNQSLSVNKVTGEVSITEINASKLLSWHKGDLVFEGNSFEEVLQAMERKFGITIDCNFVDKMDGEYYVKFSADETIEEILDILSNIGQDFCYEIDKNHVKIKKK